MEGSDLMDLGRIKKPEAPYQTIDSEINPDIDEVNKPENRYVKENVLPKAEDNLGLSENFTNQKKLTDTNNTDVNEAIKPPVDLEKAEKMVFGKRETENFKDLAERFNQIVY